MKKLEQKDYFEIESWVKRNARPLEYALWKSYKAIEKLLFIKTYGRM